MAYGYRMMALVVALFLVSTSFQANAAAVSRVYTIEDTGSFINITGGEKFNISLNEGNDFWYITPYDSSILSIEAEWNWVAHPEKLGSGSIHNWTIEGRHKGNTTISLTYGAPWDSETGTILSNFTLYVNVTSNAPMNPVWIYVIVLSAIIVVPTAMIMKWVIPEEKKKG